MSYRTWLARNPGAAPWEPAARQAASAPRAGTSRPTTGTPQLRAVEDWVTQLPLATLGLMTAVGLPLLLLLWRLPPLLARIPARPVTFPKPRTRLQGGISSGTPMALAALLRLGSVAHGVARSLVTSLPRHAQRVLDGVRADARSLRALMRERNISVGDVAFGLLAIVTAGVFGMFVVFLLAA